MKKCCDHTYCDDDLICAECGKPLEEDTSSSGVNIGDNSAISNRGEIFSGGKQVINAGNYTINQISQEQAPLKETVLKIIPDKPCSIHKDNELVESDAPKGKMTRISLLRRGEHLLSFQSLEDETDFIEHVYSVKEIDVEEFLYVNFEDGTVETTSDRHQKQQRRLAEKKANEEKIRLDELAKAQEAERKKALREEDAKRQQELETQIRARKVAEQKRQQELDDLAHQQKIADLKKQREIEDLKKELEKNKLNAEAKAAAAYVPLNPTPPASSNNNLKYIMGGVAIAIIGFFVYTNMSKEEAKVSTTVKTESAAESTKSNTTTPSVAKPKDRTTTPTSKPTVNKAETQTTKPSAPAVKPQPQSKPVEQTKPTSQPKPAAPPKPKTASELYSEGRNLAIGNNYSQAISVLNEAVSKGSVEALYYLGMIYVNGSGGNKDTAKGFGLVLQAANKGHKEAVFQAGEMYNSGTGTSKDKSQARKWYMKAQEMGDSRAASRLRRL